MSDELLFEELCPLSDEPALLELPDFPDFEVELLLESLPEDFFVFAIVIVIK